MLLIGASSLFAAVPRTVLSFEQNLGQSQTSAQYLSHLGPLIVRANASSLEFASSNGTTLILKLRDADGTWQGEIATGETVSYQIGQNRSRWVDSAKRFSRLRMKDALPGVDWLVYFKNGKLEYDFVLAHPGDITKIQMEWAGLPLQFSASGGVKAEFQDFTWQQQIPRFFLGAEELEGVLAPTGPNRAGFQLRSAPAGGPLTIDPVIEIAGVFGAEADETVVAVTKDYILGVTRSSSWEENGRRSGSDIFVRFHFGGNGYRTLIWGGTGDEELVPASAPPVPSATPTNITSAAGWTNSRDLPIAPTANNPRWTYGGGDSDGLYVSVSVTSPLVQTITAGTVSSENSEKLYAILGEPGRTLYLAGETTLAGATNASALFVKQTEGRESIWIGGGSQADRIRALLQPDPSVENFLFAAETESDDIPGTFLSISKRAGARDLWFGMLDASRSNVNLLWQSLYGGPANEDVAGLISLPGRGIFLAGTTESDNLPLIAPAQPQYGGGPTDAYVLKLSSDGQIIQKATYWGGPGAERIYHVSHLAGDLLISGSSDSTDLPSSTTIAPYEGNIDAVMAAFDANLRPYWAYRTGGTGLDQFTFAAQPEDRLPIIAGGSTSDPSWISKSSPLLHLESAGTGGGLDAFYLRIRTSLLSAPRQILGVNLQTVVSLDSIIDSNFSGTIEVVSADPEVLQLSYAGRISLATTPSLFVYNFGRNSDFSFQGGARNAFAIHSMGRTGSTEIILRAANLPERRIPVEIVPAYIFSVGNSSPFVMRVGETRSIQIEVAPLDPESGQPLKPQNPRIGFFPAISYESNDPDAFIFAPNSNPSNFAFAAIELRKEGNFSLTPSSPAFATAPNQTFRISSQPAPTINTLRYFAPSGLTWFQFVPNDAGSITVTSEDPSLIRISRFNVEDGVTSINLSPAPNNRFYIQTVGRSGRTRIRVVAANGSLSLLEVIIFQPEVFSNFPSPIPLFGETQISLSFRLTPSVPIPDSAGYQSVSLAEAPLAPLIRAIYQCGSSFPSNVQVTSFPIHMTAVGQSRCSVQLSGNYFQENEFSAIVNTVPATITWPGREILVPEGTSTFLALTPILNQSQLGNIPISYSAQGIASIVDNSSGNPATQISLTRPTTVSIRALGRAGQSVFVRFDSPALNGLQIPIRIVPAILVANYSVLRANRFNAMLFLQIGGRDGNSVLTGSYQFNQRLQLAATSSNPSVCSINPTIEFNSSLDGIYRCTSSGETTFTFTPSVSTVAPVSLRIINGTNAGDLSTSAAPILLSPSFQMAWSEYSVPQTGSVRIRSLDSGLVRLSTNQERSGSESITIPGPPSYSGGAPTIFLQAGRSTGETRIVVEQADVPPVEYKVQVVPASLVFNQDNGITVSPQTEFTLDPNNTNAPLNLRLLVAPIDPFSRETPQVQSTNAFFRYLSPDADPVTIRATSADSEILVIQPPTPILSLPWDSIVLNARPLKPGTTFVEAIQPDGFEATPGSRMKVTLRRPGFSFDAPLYLGPGMQRYAVLRLSNGNSVPAGTTITSLNPDVIALSLSSSSIGTSSLSYSGAQTLYVQAIATDAAITRASIRIEAPGYSSETFDVSIEPLVLRWSDRQSFDWMVIFKNNFNTISLSVTLSSTIAQNNSSNLIFLPGRQPSIRARSSNPQVATIPGTELSPNSPNGNSFPIPFTYVGLGETWIEIEAPPSLNNQAPSRRLVTLPRALNTNYLPEIGRGLVQEFSVTFADSDRPAIQFSVDPASGFTLGESPANANSTSLIVNPTTDFRTVIYISAGANATPTQLRISAPTYRDTEVRLTPVKPDFFFETFRISNPIPTTPSLIPLSLRLPQPWGNTAAPPSFRLSSSDPKVAAFEITTLNWQTGDQIRTFNLRILGPGTSILTLDSTIQKIEYLITVR